MAVAQKAAMHQLERQKYSIEADVKTLDLENRGKGWVREQQQRHQRQR